MQDKKNVTQDQFITNINMIRRLLNKATLSSSGVCFGLTLLAFKYSGEENIDKFTNVINLIMHLRESTINEIAKKYQEKGNVYIEYKGFKVSFKEILDFSEIIMDIQESQNYKEMMLNWISCVFIVVSDLSVFLYQQIEKENNNFSFFIHNTKHIFLVKKKGDTLLYYESNSGCARPQYFSVNQKEELVAAIRSNTLFSTIIYGGYYHIDEINYGYDLSIVDEIVRALQLSENFKEFTAAFSAYKSGKIPKNILLLYLIKEVCSVKQLELCLESVDELTTFILQSVDKSHQSLLTLKYPSMCQDLKCIIKDTIVELNLYKSNINSRIEYIEKDDWKRDDNIRHYIFSLLSAIISIRNGALFKIITGFLSQKQSIKPQLEHCLQNKTSDDSLLHAAAISGCLDVLDYLCASPNDMLIKNWHGFTPFYLCGINGHIHIMSKYVGYLNQPFSFFEPTSHQWRGETDSIVKHLLEYKKFNILNQMLSLGITLKNEEIILLPAKMAAKQLSGRSPSDSFSFVLNYKILDNLESIVEIIKDNSIKKVKIYGKVDHYDWKTIMKNFIIKSEIEECLIPCLSEELEEELQELLTHNKSHHINPF